MVLRNTHIKTAKRFKQQYNTNQNHGKHCFSLFCCLVSALFIFTLFKFENFEDRLSPRLFILMTTCVPISSLLRTNLKSVQSFLAVTFETF